jgi:hypothetical protein
MSRLRGKVEHAAPGLLGFDTAMRLSATGAVALRQRGFSFCVRYLSRTMPPAGGDLSPAEARGILAAGLALMAVQHVMRAGWIAYGERGMQYGAAAVAHARAVGLPPGVTLWLDLEGIRRGVPREDVIDYCNRWFDAVAAAGYAPGIYVGANCRLDGDALYWRLRTRHYWRSGSRVPDLPHRGYQMVQRIARTPDLVSGIDIDRNVTGTDAFGDTVTWLAP